MRKPEFPVGCFSQGHPALCIWQGQNLNLGLWAPCCFSPVTRRAVGGTQLDLCWSTCCVLITVLSTVCYHMSGIISSHNSLILGLQARNWVLNRPGNLSQVTRPGRGRVKTLAQVSVSPKVHKPNSHAFLPCWQVDFLTCW